MACARVAVAKTANAAYPAAPPFHPACDYPEYPFGSDAISLGENAAYEAVREAFCLYGFDRERYGTRHWNPLSAVIRPGDNVVLKPNLVIHYNAAGFGLEPIVTHPSILRAIADYAFLALGPGSQLTIADAPQADCDFAALQAWAQFESLRQFYEQRGFQLRILDLRKLRLKTGRERFVRCHDRIFEDGDPAGYVTVDLGSSSMLTGLSQLDRLYGSDYDRSPTIVHHSQGRHEYLVARTILNADVVIGVPKMKVHKKVGVTLNIKNLVGINGDKNFLPHYRIGSPSRGGDACPDEMCRTARTLLATRTWLIDRLLSRGSRAGDFLFGTICQMYRRLRDLFGLRLQIPTDAGNWYGNDTCWRTSVDLNAVLFFANSEGNLDIIPQRRFLSVVDGIIGGDLGGPLAATPVASGIVAVGSNPLAVDTVVTRLMGFDWRRIRQLAALQGAEDGGVFSRHFRFDVLRELEILSNDPLIASAMIHQQDVCQRFRPHPGWTGRIELASSSTAPDGQVTRNAG